MKEHIASIKHTIAVVAVVLSHHLLRGLVRIFAASVLRRFEKDTDAKLSHLEARVKQLESRSTTKD